MFVGEGLRPLLPSLKCLTKIKFSRYPICVCLFLRILRSFGTLSQYNVCEPPTNTFLAYPNSSSSSTTTESTSPDHSTSGSRRHKAEMNEAINSLTSEMVRSCEMSSFYMKRWRTDDEAMVRALTQASSSVHGGGDRTGRTTSQQVTSSRVSRSEGGSSMRTTTTTTSRTVVRVQQEQNSDNGEGNRVE